MKYLIFLLCLFSLGLVSSFPYQLNLTDGTLIDLNSSNNNGTNFTIYVIYQNVSINQTNVYNITNQNITQNITYVNMTCLNCTNYYNQSVNNTYFDYGYNKTDLNGNFVTISDFNSYKGSLAYATRDELTNQVNNLNSTITKKDTSSTGNLWTIMIIIGITQLCLIVFIVYKSRGGE